MLTNSTETSPLSSTCWYVHNFDISALGADEASAAAQSNLQTVESQVDQVHQRSLNAEKNLNESKADVSKRLQSALVTAPQEDEEIPEAYLRED